MTFFHHCRIVLLGFLPASFLAVATQAQDQNSESLAAVTCVTDEFRNNIDVSRFFKGAMYDGMLAECKMSAANNDAVKKYMNHYSTAIRKEYGGIAKKCNVSEHDARIILASYMAGIRTSGGMSMWRLVEDARREEVCPVILRIVQTLRE